jgi:hypothetical protein
MIPEAETLKNNGWQCTFYYENMLAKHLASHSLTQDIQFHQLS